VLQKFAFVGIVLGGLTIMAPSPGSTSCGGSGLNLFLMELLP